MLAQRVPLGLMHVHELLDDEVKELAGERYARKDELERGRRHGTNPGTVGLAGQRVPIRVPRVRSQEGVEIPLRSYEALNDGGEVNDLLLKRVLYGISCRNYEAAAEAITGRYRAVELDGVQRFARYASRYAPLTPSAPPVFCSYVVAGRGESRMRNLRDSM